MTNYNFTYYRKILGFQKSKRYLRWMKEKYPHQDLHHILGSVIGKKFTDYLVVPLEHSFHLSIVEKRKGYYFEKYLVSAVLNLIAYAKKELKMDSNEITKIIVDFEAETIKSLIEKIYENENKRKD